MKKSFLKSKKRIRGGGGAGIAGKRSSVPFSFFSWSPFSSSTSSFVSSSKNRGASFPPPPPSSSNAPPPTNPLFPSSGPLSPPTSITKDLPIFKKPGLNLIAKCIDWCHFQIMYLNGSKFFAGVVMILLNIGSKFIPVQFSKSLEEHMKYRLSKPILIFAMAWMATRDIYTSFILTFVIVLFSEYLLNEESELCIIPHTTRILNNNTSSNISSSSSPSFVQSAEASHDNPTLQYFQQQAAFSNRTPTTTTTNPTGRTKIDVNDVNQLISKLEQFKTTL